MAEPKGKPDTKAKAPVKKAKGYSVSKLYIVTGDRLQRKGNPCPKCGPGTFLATHKGRVTCGKCNYTEFGKR